MSCRVIGRQVETALLGVIARSLARRGVTRLVGEFVPSPKNSQVAEFYSAHGFEPLDAVGHRWLLRLGERCIELPSFIQIECQDEASNG
jgi:predicted enzyme involved in methoxymalonyl-ACP biosynthesis